MSRTYWHRAARAQRALIIDLTETESSLSEEVLTEGRQHRHWRTVAEDATERVQELTEELDRMRAEFDRLKSGLLAASEAFHAARAALIAAIPSDLTEQFGRDYVPHINLMGGLGDPDYMKGDLSCRHVDLREAKPRKKVSAP